MPKARGDGLDDDGAHGTGVRAAGDRGNGIGGPRIWAARVQGLAVPLGLTLPVGGFVAAPEAVPVGSPP